MSINEITKYTKNNEFFSNIISIKEGFYSLSVRGEVPI